MKKILFTTPIFYPNSEPHLGSAHTMVLTDFYHRLFKKLGYDSILLTGVDEHGNKIYNSAIENKKVAFADKNGNSELVYVKEFLDEKYLKFKELADILHIDYKRFIRTTDADHIKRVQECWIDLENKGYIYKGIYKGFYSLRDETFYQENELINGKSPSGDEVKFEEFSCYFLKSSIFENFIKELYKNNDISFPSNRQNSILQYISEGLKDICISRQNCKWGIDIPGRPEEGKIYVWFDALINYLSFWEDREVTHVVGKDILIFHGLHWPIILKALGHNIFSKIVVHNWWIFNQEKMSKSLGNVVNPFEIIEKYGYECLRFLIIKENLLSNDGNFSYENLIDYFNSYMVNKFSNLVYRVETVIFKAYGTLNKSVDYSLLKDELSIVGYNIREYFAIIFKYIDDINEFVDKNRIWENPSLALEIHNQIKSIIYFLEPVCPSIYLYWNEIKPFIIFKRKIF